jgi:hypothetical protein
MLSRRLERQNRFIFDIGLVALATATISRTLVAFGAPRIVDFVHIPLVVSMAVLSDRSARASRICRRAWWWLVVLFLVGEAGWMGSGGELVRPLAGWILLTEPLLFGVALTAALIAAPRAAALLEARKLRVAALVVAVVQLPFGVVQLVAKGAGDSVQGTFIGLGSASHVAGAVTFVGALSAAVFALRRRGTSMWLLVLVLLLFSVASDAKQVLIAAVPSAVVLIVFSNVGTRSMFAQSQAKLMLVLIAGGLFVVLYSTYSPLQHAGSEGTISRGSQGKVAALGIIVDHMDRRPEAFVVGLGPGNTVSKLATLTKGADLEAGSPVAFLSLSQSETTDEIRKLAQANYVLASSSAFSGLSSLLGLVGDFGILGMFAYGMAWYALVQPILRTPGNARAVVLAAVTATLVLSYVNVWLEEPNFMLPLVALVVATMAESMRAPSQASAPTATR